MAGRRTRTPNQELPPPDFRLALKASVALEREDAFDAKAIAERAYRRGLWNGERKSLFTDEEKAVLREALLSNAVEYQVEDDVAKAQLCLKLAKEFK